MVCFQPPGYIAFYSAEWLFSRSIVFLRGLFMPAASCLNVGSSAMKMSSGCRLVCQKIRSGTAACLPACLARDRMWENTAAASTGTWYLAQ